jgi:hypothetical protein
MFNSNPSSQNNQQPVFARSQWLRSHQGFDELFMKLVELRSGMASGQYPVQLAMGMYPYFLDKFIQNTPMIRDGEPQVIAAFTNAVYQELENHDRSNVALSSHQLFPTPFGVPQPPAAYVQHQQHQEIVAQTGVGHHQLGGAAIHQPGIHRQPVNHQQLQQEQHGFPYQQGLSVPSQILGQPQQQQPVARVGYCTN